MERFKVWALAHRRIIGGVVLGVLLVIVAVLLFRGCKTEPQKVTVEPQTQAQTKAGVEKAATTRRSLSAVSRRRMQRRRYAISTSMTRSRSTPSSRRGET